MRSSGRGPHLGVPTLWDALLVLTIAGACRAGDLITDPNTNDPPGGPPGGGPPSSAQLTAVGGSGQADTIGARLTQPYVVRVADGSGNPIPGVAITWAVTSGGGSVSPSQSVTDASGDARAYHTLGNTTGGQGARATATQYPSTSATFSALARHGTPISLTYEVDATDANVGAPIAPAMTLVLRDRRGNLADLASGVASIGIADGTGTPLAAAEGTLTVAIASGRAVFGDVRISLPGLGYRLRASGVGLDAQSRPFDVTVLGLP